jgi:voltage-gated potassium channel
VLARGGAFVQDLNRVVDVMNAQERFERIERATDLPMAVLALLIVPALILEEYSQLAGVRGFASALNWLVWIAFCAEYLGKLTFAPSRRGFVKRAWFDLLIIFLSPPFLVPNALQGVRAFRLLRLLRFVRAAAVAAIGLKEAGEAFRQRRFHYVVLTTIVVVSVGAVGIFAVERGENKSIASIGDAFWWAIVTTTTVGYGDVSPVTTEGRLIAVALMVIGIGFIGVFTATITSFFLEPQHRAEDPNSVESRLARIEDRLDAIMRNQSMVAEDERQSRWQKTNL